MIIRTTICTILIVLMSNATALGQGKIRRDGNFWRIQIGCGEACEIAKAAYVNGFSDGEAFGSMALSTNKAAYAFYQKEVRSRFDNVTASQVSDGLDHFYEDYRNRRILMALAVWLVIQEIAGVPETEMVRKIEQARKAQ